MSNTPKALFIGDTTSLLLLSSEVGGTHVTSNKSTKWSSLSLPLVSTDASFCGDLDSNKCIKLSGAASYVKALNDFMKILVGHCASLVKICLTRVTSNFWLSLLLHQMF